LERIAYEKKPLQLGELCSLRRRVEVELARERPHKFHAKFGYGALMDVEYVVQALQLMNGSRPLIRKRNTLEALRALVTAGILEAQTANSLEEGYNFFRGIEQGLRLLDETREPIFEWKSPSALQLARQLGYRARGKTSGE